MWGTLTTIMLILCLVTLVLELGWSSTRATTTGLQIRGWRTEFFAWNQIDDVLIDRGSSDRTSKITLHDGRHRFLPALMRGLRKHSDPTMSDAVALLRDRAGLGPAPPQWP